MLPSVHVSSGSQISPLSLIGDIQCTPSAFPQFSGSTIHTGQGMEEIISMRPAAKTPSDFFRLNLKSSFGSGQVNALPSFRPSGVEPTPSTPFPTPHLPGPLHDYHGHCCLRPPGWGWLLTAPENQDLGGKGVVHTSGAEKSLERPFSGWKNYGGVAVHVSLGGELSWSQSPFIAALFLPLGFWKAGILVTQR